ncbi:MAG: membrane protein insertase YidC [Candidatus Sungbacteria bacterium]|nr:membrane protein insertase YidC [Candidatus Sungbacteria bacterium]
MNIFSLLYTEVLFRPLFNLLVGATQVLPGHSVGLAIIAVTIIVRLLLLPSSIHQAKSMQKNQGKMEKVRHDLERIKKEHKGDQTKQAEATMKLYREAGINPASGCLPLLIQLPILLALYRVFFTGIGPESYHYLYSFVTAPETLNVAFLGLSLTAPSLLLGVLAGIGQFMQMKFFAPTPAPQPGADENTAQMMASMQKNMAYIFPVMTIFIALRLPAALSLYWVVSTVLGLLQQYLLKRTLKLTGNPTTM